jgi:GT2 family glycosyltransferase
MSADRSPVVYIAVPVWRGEDLVEATLRSILAQTWTGWRAVVSIDGGDDASASRCRPFLSDPRITLVVQPDRLGWAGNLNWLMARCDGDYFVYWQQDDLCSANYLAALVEYAEQHPEAACAYADVQWFGARTGREHTPSVTGFALQRVLAQIETMSFLPFRGLIRRQSLGAAGPLRLEAPEAAFEDLVWVVQLARAGELHVVEGPLYYKRAHHGNTHGSWLRWSAERRRAAWIECAMGMLQASLPTAPHAEWPRLLEVVVGRFALSRPGRSLIYDPANDGPAAVAVFAADLVAEAGRRFGVSPAPEALEHARDAARLLRRAVGRSATLSGIATALAAGTSIGFAAGMPGIELLGPGWSVPEPWGTWSAGPTATLTLPPLPGDSPWRVTIAGTPFVAGLAPGERRRVSVDAGGGPVEAAVAPGTDALTLAVDVDDTPARAGATLMFTFPDAVSPSALGLNEDTRPLGVALTALRAAPRR